MLKDANKLLVDLKKIKHNIDLLKVNGKKFYAVVKANAYGLGSIEISKYIEKDVDMFCVANINEAIDLRENGIDKDILILGYISPENYKYIEKYDFIITIYNFEIARELNLSEIKIRCHIKLETGHNRIGFQTNDNYFEKSFNEIKKISQFNNIKIEGIYTHFSSADEKDKEYTNMQSALFWKMINLLGNISKNWIKHLSNDAARIAYDINSEAIRSGISMYGYFPSTFMKYNYDIDLKQSFKWVSEISNIKEILKGESISYNRTFIAKENMKVATVSCGYADGYKRLISNRGYVLVNGKKANIIGNITMDQFIINITGIDATIHDEVVLIGESGNESLSADRLGKWAETISYEIMTSISDRVKRVYLR